jgi:hypothetical protein
LYCIAFSPERSEKRKREILDILTVKEERLAKLKEMKDKLKTKIETRTKARNKYMQKERRNKDRTRKKK